MSGDMSGANFAHRYSVDTRRRWSEDEKQTIIAEALQPGVNVSAAGRKMDQAEPSISLEEAGQERREGCGRAGVSAGHFDGAGEEPG